MSLITTIDRNILLKTRLPSPPAFTSLPTSNASFVDNMPPRLPLPARDCCRYAIPRRACTQSVEKTPKVADTVFGLSVQVYYIIVDNSIMRDIANDNLCVLAVTTRTRRMGSATCAREYRRTHARNGSPDVENRVPVLASNATETSGECICLAPDGSNLQW